MSQEALAVHTVEDRQVIAGRVLEGAETRLLIDCQYIELLSSIESSQLKSTCSMRSSLQMRSL